MTVAGVGVAVDALRTELAREAREARHAVILSGGGANGAYEVGVARALLEGASAATGYVPLQPQVYTGTSVGAFNAAFLAQRAGGPGAARALEEVWRDQVADSPRRCGNGVYRVRADPLRWVDPGCLAHPLHNLLETAGDAAFFAGYGLVRGLNLLRSNEPLVARLSELFDVSVLFSNTPYADLLAETIDPGRLAASPAALTVVATDWNAGKAIFFGKAEIGRLGTDVIKASGAIPGLFQPVLLDGKLFVDGSLKMNTPLGPAIDDGADVLHVIYVDPDVADIPYPSLPNTLDTFYRSYVIVIASSLNADIFTADLINEDRELAERLDIAAGDPMLAGLTILQKVLMRREGGNPYRPLVIHRYRPKLPLGSLPGLLDFSAGSIDQRIAKGYDDAVHHDCRVEQCILPPTQAVRAGLRG